MLQTRVTCTRNSVKVQHDWHHDRVRLHWVSLPWYLPVQHTNKVVTVCSYNVEEMICHYNSNHAYTKQSRGFGTTANLKGNTKAYLVAKRN